MIGKTKVIELYNLVDSEILYTRPVGEEVRKKLVAEIHRASENTFIIDFKGIIVIDFSCADEIIAILQQDNKQIGNKRLLLTNLTEHHRENIEIAMKERKQAILTTDGILIGHLPSHLESLLATVIQKKSVTAREIADDSIDALAVASQKLRLLWSKGLAGRFQEKSSEGMQYIYTSLV